MKSRAETKGVREKSNVNIHSYNEMVSEIIADAICYVS